MTNLTLLVSLLLGTPQVQCAGGSLGSLVRDQLFNEAVRMDRAADAAWTECSSREALVARQSEVRARTLAAIGGFPEKTPLNAKTLGRVRKDGYVIEKVLFESRPKHYVTAHLFLPDNPKYKAPYPGAVSPCGHSLAGKNAPWYQRVGVTGAKLGVATLVYDPVEQGERHQLRDGRTQWSTTREHNRIGHRASLLGWGTAHFRIWDGIRACDYLASRPDVNAAQLGVTGLSGGGTLSSYLNALDDRYAAGAPAGFLSTVRDVFDNCGPQDAEQVIFGQLKHGFNHLGIVALRAPSPVMLVTSHADFFPFMGSVDTFENARRVYGMLGVSDRVELMETAGPHHWYESTRHAAFWWIRRWAAGDADAWPRDRAALRRLDLDFAYSGENSGVAFDTPEIRNVTASGFTLDIPGARSVYDVMRDELARIDSGRAALSQENVRAVAGIRPLADLKATPVAVKETAAADGRVVRMLLSRDDDLVPLPMVAFLPAAAKGVPVLLFTDGARKTLEGEVKRLLSEGRAVAVAEMRGFGETAKGGKSSFYGAVRADEEMAMLSFAIGENLVSRRAEDIALAARQFAAMAGVDKVALSATGAASIPAAHAYFLERRLFASFDMKSAPASWRNVVEDVDRQFAFADIVYGALRVYDWIDLVR